MTRDFKEALRHRRTYYHITDSSPISDEQIKEIIDFAVMNVPSAFNSQSTRIVLLLGKNHKKLCLRRTGSFRSRQPDFRLF